MVRHHGNHSGVTPLTGPLALRDVAPSLHHTWQHLRLEEEEEEEESRRNGERESSGVNGRGVEWRLGRMRWQIW